MRTFCTNLFYKKVLLFWSIVLFVIPIVIFIFFALFISKPPSELTQIKDAEIWLEPLGNRVFDHHNLDQILRSPPDFSNANWVSIKLPYTKELGASIDLPPNATKTRAWIRFNVPNQLNQQFDPYHRLGILGNRIMAGGPWSVWLNKKLVIANAPDWRMQWNIPLQAMLPALDKEQNEIIISFPYAQAQGFAIGSVFLGTPDAIHHAWDIRHFLHIEIPRISSVIALLLLGLSLQLTFGRPKETVFILLSVCTLIWAVSNAQYLYDLSAQPELFFWFGAAVDITINWWIIFHLLFAFEFERIKVPVFSKTLLLYGCVSTIITLPIWNWQQNALMVQHIINLLMFIIGLALFTVHVFRKPRREGVVILIALIFQLATGFHSLFFVTNQTHPDHFMTFPIGCIALFAVFVYVINRRTLLAINAAEVHQHELETQLNQQKNELAAQHQKMQELEVQNQLALQKETLMQDLHDGLGSNLTSAILCARSGALKDNDTLHLLEDIYSDLRSLHKTNKNNSASLNQILSELRERIGQRLIKSGIELNWQVKPNLPALPVQFKGSEHHLRALLNETFANIIKHARATLITVKADIEHHTLVLDVSDNGIGFDYETIVKGRGLIGMQQRAHMINAQLTITTQVNSGTHWQLKIPL